MKLALGTAQFGLNYGVANQQGKIGPGEARAILAMARANGVDLLDTAVAYGDSEASLGAVGVQDWRLVTKIPAYPEHCIDIAGWVDEQVQSSLTRLGIDSLYGLLLHSPKQLLDASGEVLYQSLRNLKARSIVKKIGISIYDPDELTALCSQYAFDLIQAPLHVLDRRLIDTGWLARLSAQGVEIHARSVFLQGLLLMCTESRPQKFARWQPLWNRWESWLEEHQLKPVEVCLRYALAVPEVTQVVVGVDSASQFRQILTAAEGGALPILPADLCTDDINLLNPARWGVL